ncbi:MAG: hypothetical protein JNM25_19910 [Planctomycetes bacterium]|nr:hypothetical protein [Planctomycetota bacterium]
MRQQLAGVAFLVLAGLGADAIGQKPAVEAQERHFVFLPRSSYFVIAPRKPVAKGKLSRLLVVLPGGDGSREFLPFVRDGIAAQVPDDCVVAMLAAVKWRDDQQVVWPTAKAPVADMAYPTEDYVAAVVKQLTAEFAVDPAERAVLAWSSSGPAVYPLLCAADGPFPRGYVAMSVWPEQVATGDLTAVKGRRFVLDQSPDDQTTPFRHVRAAHAALTDAGAIVRVSVYDGGHGWHDRPLPRLKEGLRWLWSEQPAPAPKWPPPPKPGTNLVVNGGFEQGLDGWRQVDNSTRLVVEIDKGEHASGKRSLHVRKTGGGPLDLVVQEVELPAGGALTASAMVRSQGAANAWVKVWRYDAHGEAIGSDVDLLRVPQDGDWQRVEKTWPRDGAVRAVVQVILVLGGDVWVDDVALSVAK